MNNDNLIGGAMIIFGGLLSANKHAGLGIPILLFGALTVKFLDCYVVPSGNTNAGQTQCSSLLGKWIGPM